MVLVRVKEANEHLEGLYTTGGEVWFNLFCTHIEILILPVRQPQQYDHERHSRSIPINAPENEGKQKLS
jgi:hypothetical protein